MAGWDDGRGKFEVAEADAETEQDTAAGAPGEGKQENVRKWEACKPWRGARCALYHEHDETERCGDVFLGR
jgi:hypothetical protein